MNVDHFKVWKCPKCNKEVLAPTHTVMDKKLKKVIEYKCSCEIKIEDLDDTWCNYFNVLGFKVEK